MEISQLSRITDTQRFDPGVWQMIGDTMPMVELRRSAPDLEPRYLYSKKELTQRGSNIQSGGHVAPYSKGYAGVTIEDLPESTEIKPRITSYLFDDVRRPEPDSGYMLPRLYDQWTTKVLNEEHNNSPDIGFYPPPNGYPRQGQSRGPEPRRSLIYPNEGYGGLERQSPYGSFRGVSGTRFSDAPAPAEPGERCGVVSNPYKSEARLAPGQTGGGNF